MPVRPTAAALRHRVHNGEVQFATVVRVARDGRPIVAAAAHADQRTDEAVAITRSGEIYGGIRTGYLVVEVPTIVPCAIGVHRASVLTIGGETSKGIGGGQLETGRAGVVDGLDDSVVIETSYGVVSRP